MCHLPHRELESWVHDMQTLIAAVELAKDVASAEATLQGHRERKVSNTILHVSSSISLSYTFYSSSISSLSSHSFRVKLMRRKTVLRQLHSLARLSFPPATLPQRKSRLISRAWPAREHPCWPPGRRSRQSLSSAWNYSCF